MTFPPGIIFYFLAISVQFDPLAPAILEAMKMYLNAGLMKATYLVKGVYHSPVIYGKRDVHAYYVQMLIHRMN